MSPRWRLGTTSFIHRAGWLENARRLAGRVEDVELLFFDPDGPGGLPDEAEVRGLAELRRTTGLGYTVHAPLGAPLASADEARRRLAVARVRAAVERALPLQPRAVVIHLYPGEVEGAPALAASSPAAGWEARATASLQALLGLGLPPATFCVESLDAGLDVVAPPLGGARRRSPGP
jgi:sugar phosphate isomerase/epimerase